MAAETLAEIPSLTPLDQHNRRLQENVHPPEWVNPAPKPQYDLIVIGAGTAGLVCAAGAAGLGARVALIEKSLMGGDCLNVGCVPSKALIRAARAAAEIREAGAFGVRLQGLVEVDFPAVMQRLRKLRADLSGHDSAQRFRGLGVDVFIGEGRFMDRRSIGIGPQVLRFSKAAIATGARAVDLPIPGLAEAGYLTNENIFCLTRRPARLAVIGGGPIGCELAQAFARLGTQVFLLEQQRQLLPREDRDAAAIVKKALVNDGIEINCCCNIKSIRARDNRKLLALDCPDAASELTVDEILIGVGRAPNVEGLNLEAAGVKYDKRGVQVDDFLRTTNGRIFAAGDICSPYKFTHAADAMARIVIHNALFLGRKRIRALMVPWCTYTDPEVAHVGRYPTEAEKRGIIFDTVMVPLEEVDRAVLDSETTGFLKVHVRKGSGQILGATLVARHAGEMISELTLAMQAGVSLGRIASVIHPYPTQAEIIKRAADQFNRRRLTPRVRKLLGLILSMNRW
ncbi:MAG: mercuric reductase [Planctomycetes bacterium]|nr:mercuric reductase [Planctomycetota bacterium]